MALLVPKRCPICGKVEFYETGAKNIDGSPAQAPAGWIRLCLPGFEGIVCSMPCVVEARRRGERRVRQLGENKLVLPPDVEI